jgi:hypothetical protein
MSKSNMLKKKKQQEADNHYAKMNENADGWFPSQYKLVIPPKSFKSEEMILTHCSRDDGRVIYIPVLPFKNVHGLDLIVMNHADVPTSGGDPDKIRCVFLPLTEEQIEYYGIGEYDPRIDEIAQAVTDACLKARGHLNEGTTDFRREAIVHDMRRTIVMASPEQIDHWHQQIHSEEGLADLKLGAETSLWTT